MLNACAQSDVHAVVAEEQALAPTFDQLPKAKEMAQRLFETHGIALETTLSLLRQATYLPRVVELVQPPKTSTVRNWDIYRSRFVEPYRIRRGAGFWADNARALEDAEREHGVPQAVIVAIIGVETIYGQHTGQFRVLDSLATLGFAYPAGQKDRSDFFLKELESFIVLCKKTQLNPLEEKGSYAGAIGLGQFMPSSWLAYGVDGDKDGKVDLFHNNRDAIFSVANFLKVHGWVPGKATLVPVELGNNADMTSLLAPDILPSFTAQELSKKGAFLKAPVLADEKLALIELARGENAPTYVAGGQNFYVVTRYNRSSFYSTAVLELAEALALNRKLNQAGKTPVDK